MESGFIVFLLQDMVECFIKSEKIETARASPAPHPNGWRRRFHLDIRVHGKLLLTNILILRNPCLFSWSQHQSRNPTDEEEPHVSTEWN